MISLSAYKKIKTKIKTKTKIRLGFRGGAGRVLFPPFNFIISCISTKVEI